MCRVDALSTGPLSSLQHTHTQTPTRTQTHTNTDTQTHTLASAFLCFFGHKQKNKNNQLGLREAEKTKAKGMARSKARSRSWWRGHRWRQQSSASPPAAQSRATTVSALAVLAMQLGEAVLIQGREGAMEGRRQLSPAARWCRSALVLALPRLVSRSSPRRLPPSPLQRSCSLRLKHGCHCPCLRVALIQHLQLLLLLLLLLIAPHAQKALHPLSVPLITAAADGPSAVFPPPLSPPLAAAGAVAGLQLAGLHRDGDCLCLAQTTWPFDEILR